MVNAWGDCGNSWRWQHRRVLIAAPRNPRYSSGLAVGVFIKVCGDRHLGGYAMAHLDAMAC